MKTLVVRLDHLGDLLLTTPLVRALAHGGHTVDVLIRSSLKPIFLHSPHVNECFGIEEIAPGFPSGWLALGRWMRSSRYDTIVLAYARQKELCFASLFSGARRRVAMWSGIWGRLTGHRCPPSGIEKKPRPAADILLDCSRALGVSDQGLNPEIFLPENERTLFRETVPAAVLRKGQPLILIHPGSAGNACNLPGEVYGHLASLILKETNWSVAITGLTSEESLLTAWPRDVLESDRVWNAMGQLSVRQLACLTAEGAVSVCSSTGPLHVASAVQTASVSPFCPKPPLCAAIWGNMGARSKAIEPAYCPRQNGSAVCCEFGGQISARHLLREVTTLVEEMEMLSGPHP